MGFFICGHADIFIVGVCPLHCRMFSSIPDTHPIVTIKNVSRYCHVSQEGNHLWPGITGLSQITCYGLIALQHWLYHRNEPHTIAFWRESAFHTRCPCPACEGLKCPCSQTQVRLRWARELFAARQFLGPASHVNSVAPRPRNLQAVR